MSRRDPKHYTREFKLEAVRLAETSGKTLSEIEHDLDITAGLLSQWRKRLAENGNQAFPGRGRLQETDEEIRHLKRELEVVRQERDILKKAVAIFSRTKP